MGSTRDLNVESKSKSKKRRLASYIPSGPITTNLSVHAFFSSLEQMLSINLEQKPHSPSSEKRE